MNINPLVESSLAALMFNGKSVPVEHLFYSGQSVPYITYYTYLDQDEYFADDEPQGGNAYGTVDVFSRKLGNYKGLVRDVQQMLRSAGFRVKIEPERYENDTKLVHTSIDINIENTEV